MDNANNTNLSSVSYDDLMVGDSIYIPCRSAFFTLAWAGNGVIGLEVGNGEIWQIHECQDGTFGVAP